MDKTTDVRRRRFKQVLSLKERLLEIAREAKERAATLPPGAERQELLAKARETKLTAELEDWLSSPGLQPPK
jgi:hypothetical protein